MKDYQDIRPLTIRCDSIILAKIKAIAKFNRRSMNSQIEECLASAIKEFEKINGELEVDIYQE